MHLMGLHFEDSPCPQACCAHAGTLTFAHVVSSVEMATAVVPPYGKPVEALKCCSNLLLSEAFAPPSTAVFPEHFQFSSVQCGHSVVSDSLRPHESQCARPPCLSHTYPIA